MLQRNDNEINTLFSQGHSLNKAKQMQKKQWNKLPTQGMQIGGGLGIVIPKHEDNKVSKGVGSMKNNGRVDSNSSTLPYL